MTEELTRLILTHGRPVKDEEWDRDWRDYDWDHEGNGCSGWQKTAHEAVYNDRPSRLSITFNFDE